MANEYRVIGEQIEVVHSRTPAARLIGSQAEVVYSPQASNAKILGMYVEVVIASGGSTPIGRRRQLHAQCC